MSTRPLHDVREHLAGIIIEWIDPICHPNEAARHDADAVLAAYPILQENNTARLANPGWFAVLDDIRRLNALADEDQP